MEVSVKIARLLGAVRVGAYADVYEGERRACLSKDIELCHSNEARLQRNTYGAYEQPLLVCII